MTTPHDKLRAACVEVEEAGDLGPRLGAWFRCVACLLGLGDSGNLFRADDNLTRAAFVLAENRASILALLDEVERLRARPTWERVLRIANGCTDYGGGHHGADHEVYQHGIWTVCNVLKNACEQGDKPDMQLRVVEAIGAEALTPGEPEEGGAS